MPEQEVIERAQSNEFTYWCRECYAPGEPGAVARLLAVKRQVTMEWEHEYGDFGSKLASWPEFVVEPKCHGPQVDWRNFPNEFTEDKYLLDCITGIESTEEVERHPWQCPFAYGFDNYDHPAIVEILAAWRERNAFAKLCGVKNFA